MNRSIRWVKGFTLIELMVVILILGVLIALLLPAINGAVKTAKDASVTAEINQLATGLADFKSKYNRFPPSRVILREDGTYNTATTARGTWFGSNPPAGAIGDMSYATLASQSLKVMKSLWPRAYFVEGVRVANDPNTFRHDFNGNGSFDDGDIYLEGHECLVFFLGGVQIPEATGGPGLAGFANSPTNPFSSTATNRSAPMMEFRTSRLIDDDNDGMYGYVDPIGSGGSDNRYYAYFSTSGSGGYNPHDCNFATATEPETPIAAFKVDGVLIASPAPNPYTSSQAFPVVGNYETGALATSGQSAKFIKPDSYQLFSAGRDRIYGPGGQYLENETVGKMPFPAGANQSAGGAAASVGVREVELDNIANFKNGRLD